MNATTRFPRWRAGALAVLAGGLSVWLIAGLAQAAPSSAAKPAFGGKTKIREVKILRPTARGERGSLVVWVRATHASLRESAASETLAGSTHKGRVRVRVEGLGSRTAVHPLSRAAGEDKVDHGYTVRFDDRRSRARIERVAANKVDVRVKATQTVDLDGDGGPEAVSSARAKLRVAPTVIESTIDPADGEYQSPLAGDRGGFFVYSGQIYIFYVTNSVGCGSDVTPSAPIDPSTGEFAINYKGVNAAGTFQADGKTANVDVSWEGVLGYGGPKCQGALAPNTPFSYVGKPPEGR